MGGLKGAAISRTSIFLMSSKWRAITALLHDRLVVGGIGQGLLLLGDPLSENIVAKASC